MTRNILMLALFMTSACYTTRITFQKEARGVLDENWDGKYHHGLVYGMVELSDPVALGEICPAGVAYVQQEQTFINSFVNSTTRGIYTPQSVWVYCVDGSASAAVLDDRGRVVALAQTERLNQPPRP